MSGLTTRGRCLLAAGTALCACAIGLGQRDLLRAGLFLTMLPLAAVVTVARTRYRLTCTRHLEPTRVQAGRQATVRLRLDNVSRLPSGVLLMEDTLPYALGGSPRFVLDRVEPRGVRDVTYPVRAEARGRYAVGPLAVRLTDPFGLCELTRSFTSTDDLIVTPVLSSLPPIRLGGDWSGAGGSTARTVAVSGSDDAATREYRHGDDLRKVHWRSTARVGELMVRREEQPVQSRATFLLDGRLAAHRGEGPGSSLEYAISAVASIAVALSRAGFILRLIRETGDEVVPGHLTVTENVVLDALAVAKGTRAVSLSPATERLRSAPGGALIVVVGALDVDDCERLARLRLGSGRCIAVALDVDSWTPTSARQRPRGQQPADRTRAMLAAAGWRVLPAAFGTALPTLWPLADARPVSSGRPA